MAAPAVAHQPLSPRVFAGARRFFRWLTRTEVVLSLIMLLVMFYLVIIRLYRMVLTTVTWQPHDVVAIPGAEVGGLTLYHYGRMLSGALSRIYMYTPLWHSLTIATGATLLALCIGGSLAWLVVRTNMPGRKLVNQLALIPYIMPSWTLAQAWLVFFKNRLSGGTPGVFEYLVGTSPPNWLSYGPVPIMICSAVADLFSGPESIQHVMEMLKLREIYRHLSNCADRGDAAANVVHDIVVKMT